MKVVETHKGLEITLYSNDHINKISREEVLVAPSKMYFKKRMARDYKRAGYTEMPLYSDEVTEEKSTPIIPSTEKVKRKTKNETKKTMEEIKLSEDEEVLNSDPDILDLME